MSANPPKKHSITAHVMMTSEPLSESNKAPFNIGPRPILLAQVTDASGTPVEGLKQENFRIFLHTTGPQPIAPKGGPPSPGEVHIIKFDPFLHGTEKLAPSDPQRIAPVRGIYEMSLDFEHPGKGSFTFLILLVEKAQGMPGKKITGQTLATLTKLV